MADAGVITAPEAAPSGGVPPDPPPPPRPRAPVRPRELTAVDYATMAGCALQRARR